MNGTTHDLSLTCIAATDINQYASVKLSGDDYVATGEVDGIPQVHMTGNGNDTIFGIAMTDAVAGELVTVKLPYSALLPAYVYRYNSSQPAIEPGVGLTIGTAISGSLSTFDEPGYERKVAYIVQVKGPQPVTYNTPVWCEVVFVRSYYI